MVNTGHREAAGPALSAALVRLRTENAELRAALESRQHENGLLLQMITDVISTLDVEQVLHHIVENLEASFGCHAAFVYLWDREHDLLVLRGASARYRHVVGKLRMAPGEGLVGWSALTRKPSMLRERAMDDPRFRYFPELDEEQFQAMMTVPMTGADGAVVAVISMHTVAPQEFTEEHVHSVAAMAPILGGAIESSEIYESTTRKLAVLATLSGLVQIVHSGRYLDDALRSLAETTLHVTGSDLCALVLSEPGLERLSVRAYGPGSEAGPGTLYVAGLERQPWQKLAEMESPTGLGLPVEALSERAIAAGSTRLVAPLVAAGEQLGVMICYSAMARQYADDDAALLNIIANQAAIAIKNSQLADLLAERDVPARLFRDLTQGPEDSEELMRRRAALLGCDLARPHAPVVLDVAGVPPGNVNRETTRGLVSSLLRRWLADAYAGSLVHVDTTVLALVRLPAAEDEAALPDQFEEMQALAEHELGLHLAGGIGRACRAPAEYRRGFAEAREALRVGKALRRGGILHFDRLGAARYLTRIPVDGSGDELHDRYQECVERVAAYDARKNTTLLQTLDMYLSRGGSIAHAAEGLYVHRNTLVQRLEKLHDLLGLDPHDSNHWLALHIALNLRRLREP